MCPAKMWGKWSWWDADHTDPVDASDTSGLISNMFNLLKGGTLRLYFREYDTEREALQDLQYASEQLCRNQHKVG